MVKGQGSRVKGGSEVMGGYDIDMGYGRFDTDMAILYFKSR